MAGLMRDLRNGIVAIPLTLTPAILTAPERGILQIGTDRAGIGA